MNRLALALGLASLVMACEVSTEPSSRGARTSGGSEPSSVPLPPEAQQPVARALGIGRLLFEYDKVAAEGTDVMLAATDAADRANTGGYLVLRGEQRWSVVFFTKDEDPRISARITVEPGKPSVFQRVRPAEPASEAERIAIRARQAAIAAVPRIVQRLNPVVFTGADAVEVRRLAGEIDGAPSDEKVIVYLLAASARPNVAVLGRHYRAVARTDGTIEKIEPMSKTALEIPGPPPGVKSGGVFMFVTHVLGDWPTEAHVFASLLYRQSVFVITSRGNFHVEGDRIEGLSR